MRMKTLLAAATVAAFAMASGAHAAVNLVTNGDFAAGNTGFTSGYTYAPATNNAEGQYTITDNAFPWNPNFASVTDHTGSGGMMFVGNGSPTAGQLVWNSGPIAITAGTDYFFEAFVANVCCNAGYSGGNSPPNLAFSISLDGGPATILNTLSIPLSPVGAWNGLSTSFNSGGATTATLSLINANTIAAGNDFAVDDVFLGTTSTVLGIPEPTSWALMILGFGGIGAVIRRRRNSHPAFAA